MALTSSPENPQPLRTVAQGVLGWVDRLGAVWVSGQLVQVNRRQGTVFVVMRDEFAEVSVNVSMSTTVFDAAGQVTDGMSVIAWVKPQYWMKSGRLSFECRDLRPTGEGRLLAAIEHRKRMLQAEGLFDAVRKRSLPVLPRIVGLVTSKDSAAERDVIDNIRLRWPAARIEVAYASVQGQRCADEVINSLRRLDAGLEVDVVIVARGGGSVEDLLPFSDEGLVRAVSAMSTPVVSAIGHETDSPILDLVADLRASTPTDAAKRVVPDVAEETERVHDAARRLRNAMSRRIATEREGLAALHQRPALRNPAGSLVGHREHLATARQRLKLAIRQRLSAERMELDHQLAQIRALSPRATLQRGYVILSDGAGETITSVAQLDPGDDIAAQFTDGTAVVEVRSIEGNHE